MITIIGQPASELRTFLHSFFCFGFLSGQKENERLILANSIRAICLESALFFCTFALSISDDDCKQETPALSSV